MKKDKIERVLFWFKDGGEDLTTLNNQFFGLAILLNRLINEAYTGERIKFINIDFASDEKYKIFPQIAKNFIHYYNRGGGHLRFYGAIDFMDFYILNEKQKNNYIWERAYNYLKLSANKIENMSLLDAVDYAYHKGIELNLNTDFKVVEANSLLYSQHINISIYIVFKDNSMISKLVLKKEELVILERKIDEVESGAEFFLEIYKSIEIKENMIIIKGNRDVKYLPLKIPIDKSIFE